MLLIRNFNRRFTVRKLVDYGSPRIYRYANLEFPRGSIYHYLDLDYSEIAPPNTLHVFRNLEKPAQVRHHFELTQEGQLGRPIKVPFIPDKDILKYHRLNRNLRRNRDTGVIEKDNKVLLIENYTPIMPKYRYPDTILSWYERIMNLVLTVKERILLDTTEFERQNYLEIKLPSELPAFSNFVRAQRNRGIAVVKPFQSYGLVWLLEIFTWLGTSPDASVLGELTEEQARRINFLFSFKDGVINVNLGELYGWSGAYGGPVSEDQMQRRFYKTIVNLMTNAPTDLVESEIESDDPRVVVSNVDESIVTNDAPLVLVRDEVPEAVIELEAEDFQEEIKKFDAEKFDEDAPVVIKEVADIVPDKNILVIDTVIDHRAIIKRECDKLAEAGRISTKAYQFLNEAAEKFEKLPSPYNPALTIGESTKVDPKELEVEPKLLIEDSTLLDKSWVANATQTMTRNYNVNILPKDIVASVGGLQNMGVVIHDYRIEKELSATGHVEHHSIRIQPVGGEPITKHFTLPVVDEDGYWTANGVEYTMRRQRVDVPIRKVDYNTVALTTFYGKNFVRRSEKVAHDYPAWVGNQLSKIGISAEDKRVTDIKFANVFTPEVLLPRDYTSVARRVSSFKGAGLQWHFDYASLDTNFDKDSLKAVAKLDMYPVAKSRTSVWAMDKKSNVYEVKDTVVTPRGTLTEVLSIDTEKAPREFSEISFMGKSVPLGLVFSYYLGLEGMLQEFKISYNIHPASERISVTDHDLVLRLSDAKISIDCETAEQRLLVNGLRPYLKRLPQYTESEVNRRDVYLNLIAEDGLTSRYLKELDNMETNFVDPIHARILRRMNEPEVFLGLLKRSNELLTNDQTLPEINGEEMMFLGSQRIAGHVYTGLMRAMRNYNNQPASSKKFDLTNDMIWGELASDPSVLVAQGANPIQCIKEQDVITMGGSGGRNKKTMVKRTRAFAKSDLGMVSGDTVDNGDVSITSYLSANPQFDNIDGTGRPREMENQSVGSLMSFCVGLAPDSLADDDKRWNFVNIQMGSGMASEHYGVSPFRTGQEKLVSHRTSNKHATIAPRDGRVMEVDDVGVTVEYLNPKESITYPLGRWFGSHEGTMYPHDNVTKWKKGNKVPEGTVITYNDKHFQVDEFNPTQVNWKNGVMANVALIEGEPTFEDSSTLDEWLSEQLEAEVTKPKDVSFPATSYLVNLLKPGDKIDYDTILCTFADATSSGMDGFSEEVSSTLSKMSSHSPRAGVKGVIDRIEIVYHGEIEDMSESVGAVVKTYDRIRRREAKASATPKAETGSVDGSYRVDGNPLEFNYVAIRFFITHLAPAVGGDKAVVANQMKTTHQYVMTDTNETEDGTPVNMYFGRASIEGRIVGSVYRIGTTIPICYEMMLRGRKIMAGEKVIPFK